MILTGTNINNQVANIETGKPRESTSKSSRRNRKRRHKTTGVLDSSGPDSERSEIELSDTEIPDKVSRTDTNVAPPPHDLPAATATIPSSETLAEISISETEETTEAPVCYDLSDDQQTCNSETETPTSMPVPDDNLLLTPSTSNATTDTTSSGANTSTATGLKQALHTPASQAPSSSPVNSGSRTPTSLKDTLKQLRIEKSVCTLQSSGRKMWSEDETRCLIRIWEEESARVWASAGKKMLSLKRIADLLIVENVDRDISQIEGKIKALKRDYKAVKQDKAIPAIQTKMAPYLEKLEAIFSREDLI